MAMDSMMNFCPSITFEGKVQEIGTYVYVVSGSGVDNVQYYKQGNFTLVL